MLENRMVIDEEWDELEYGVKHETHQKRKARIFEETEHQYGRKKKYEFVRN